MFYKTTIPFQVENLDGFQTENGPRIEATLPNGHSVSMCKEFFQANFSFVAETLEEANAQVLPQPRAEEDGLVGEPSDTSTVTAPDALAPGTEPGESVASAEGQDSVNGQQSTVESTSTSATASDTQTSEPGAQSAGESVPPTLDGAAGADAHTEGQTQGEPAEPATDSTGTGATSDETSSSANTTDPNQV